MIQRLLAYSFISLGFMGTLYLGFGNIVVDERSVPALMWQDTEILLEDSSAWMIIDVRTEAEQTAQPLPWKRSIHIPLHLMEERSAELADLDSMKFLVVCPTGNRSRQAARVLRMAGFESNYLEGGLKGMAEEGS